MTEQIKTLEVFKEIFSGEDTINAFDIAIRSLKAWEEVLTELEEQLHIGKDSNWKNATINAICIINQHLSDVPDNNVGEIEE